MDNQYPMGATHPLELAHEDFARLLKPWILEHF